MNQREDKVLILNSTPVTNQVIIPILNNYKEKNILLVNYTLDIDNKYLHAVLELEEFKSFEIFKPRIKNIKAVKDKLEELTTNDLVLFIGLESLFIDTAKDTFKVSTYKKTFYYKSYENIDFLKIMGFIDYLYLKSNTNLFFLVTTSDKNISERVTKELNDFDITIMSMRYVDKNKNIDDFDIIEKELLETITYKSYEEAISVLEKYEAKLSKASFRQTKVAILLKHGFGEKAIDLLSTSYEDLEITEKLILADLYFDNEIYHQAFNIAKTVFEENPLVLDAPDILLKIVIALNIVEEWYKKIIEVDSSNRFVFERLANYFTQVKKFKKAMNLRNHLFKLTKKPLHLLLIEILKVEDEKPKNAHIMESNILKIVKSSSDEELEIEASFNLGRTWFEVYNSPQKAYYHFKDVLKQCDNSHAVISAEYRMKLLSNQGYSNKIIKPSYQKKYPDKLPTMRINELFNSLLILTNDNIGYITWQNFIDDSQTIEIWKKFLLKRTISELKEIDTTLMNSYIKESSIFKELKKSDVVQLAREYKKDNSIEDFNLKENHEALVSMSKSLKEQIWTRYYLVLYFAHNGEPQLANNHAISLWFLANTIKDNKGLSKLSRHLGTLAWGIAQYRNGKEIEGISSILVTIKYFMDTKEVIPFMEDALGILNIWIQMNKELISKDNIVFFITFFKELSKEHIVETDVSEYLIKEDWESIYNKLGYKIYNSKEYNSQWGLDFYYYMVASSRLGKLDINLMLNNLDNVIDAMKSRKDGRSKLLFSLAEIIFGHGDENKACLKLLKIAIQDIEQQRKEFKNTYERGFLSDSHRMIYQLYLVINVLVLKMDSLNPNEKNQIINNILNTFDYLSPRVLNEKKENHLKKEQITEEIQNIEKEYLSLIEDLSQYSLNNFKDAYIKDEYTEKSRKYKDLKNFLEKEHPTYQNDLNFEHIPIQLIQESLKDDEIYYQYINTKSFICYLIITKRFIDTNFNQMIHIDKDAQELASSLQNFTKSTTYNIEDIHKLYFQLSQKYFNPLLTLYKTYKKIYINGDLTIPLLSSNLIRLEDNWLIEKVDFIVNVTNKNYFIGRKDIRNFNFKIATLGKKSNKQMIETKKWINQDALKKSVFIDEFEVNINTVDNILEKNKSNSLLLISHGIQGDTNSSLTGALSIDGEKKSYKIDDFSFITKLDCMYFLTCSSGSFSIGEHETSNSIINNILSKDINNVILCRWDVFLNVSLEISENIITLSKNQGIEYSLNQALKEILKNKKWEHPVYWAGIEVWKN